MIKKEKYLEYEKLQKENFCSLESDNELWKKGQQRFIEKMFGNTVRDAKIIDIACGDGVGLRCFRKMGFKNVSGVEFNRRKSVRARKIGYKIYNADIHNLDIFQSDSFEIVYSSHTIEHAFDVVKAVREMVRILSKTGMMVVVLPYPDRHLFNIKAHVAKYTLGTNRDDKGKKVKSFFERMGLKIISCNFDYFREPEIWLVMVKR